MNIDFSPAIEQVQDMINSVIRLIPNLIVAMVLLLIGLYIGRWTQTVVRRVSDRSHRHKNLGLVLGRMAQWSVMLLSVLIASVVVFPRFSPGQVIELLGIGSVAIGFAFRDILQNFLSGIIILLTEPFRLDDQIRIGEFEGTVEDIQTRATSIVTYDGRRVVIPNGELLTTPVTVNTAFDLRRLEYDVGIGYGDDIERAKAIMLDTVRSIDAVLSDPAPDVLVFELGDFAVVLRLRWWITPPRRVDALDMRDRILEAVKRDLVAAGIDLPFPTQHVLFHNQTEDADGDRTRQREGWPPAPDADAPRIDH